MTLLDRATNAYCRFAGTIAACSSKLSDVEEHDIDWENQIRDGSLKLDLDAFDGGSSGLIGIPEELDCREEQACETTDADIPGWYREDLDSIRCESGIGASPQGIDLCGMCHPDRGVHLTMIPFARAGDDDAIPAVLFLRCAACGQAVCAIVLQEIAPVEDCCRCEDHGFSVRYRQGRLLLKCGGCDRVVGEVAVRERPESDEGKLLFASGGKE